MTSECMKVQPGLGVYLNQAALPERLPSGYDGLTASARRVFCYGGCGEVTCTSTRVPAAGDLIWPIGQSLAWG
jgi:hypothetical protein